MIILDTNVISELMKPVASPEVETWCNSQSDHDLFITTTTQAEILYGISILPTGARKQELQARAERMLSETFANRILPFDQNAAEHYATIAAHRRSQGKPISQFDAQIAAICRTHQATLATRNVNDFIDCGLEIVNPWEP